MTRRRQRVNQELPNRSSVGALYVGRRGDGSLVADRSDDANRTYAVDGRWGIGDNLLLDPDEPTQAANAPGCLSAVFDLVLGLGGTLSGEHGIGTAKCRFMEKETSRATMVYSRRIKSAMDPHNILNPGKIIGGQS